MTTGEAPPSERPNERLTREGNWIIAAHGAGSAQRMPAPSDTGRSARTRPRQRAVELQPADWDSRGEFEYIARSRELLVDDLDLARVIDVLRAAGAAAEVADSLFGGVSLIEVDVDIVEALELTDARLGVGVAAPNHVFGVTGNGDICPATEPAEPDRADPWPVVGHRGDGRGVRVAVVDTGFLRGWESRSQTPWLAGVTEYDVDDPDVLAPAGFIDPYAGHGTFVAGVVRCMAPATEVTVDGIFELAGVVDEASIVVQIGDALARSPDIINLSAGGYTRRNLPPKAFVALWESKLRHYKGMVMTAAAGNNTTRTPFWPAAFPWAVSVGALTADGRARAEFSNFGGWVDVYAPGEDIVNAYCEGEYQYLLQPGVTRKFDGLCKWSGTSFSTPIVTGMIAARMSRTGENARQAADALLDFARGHFLPGVGPRLLP